MTHETQIIGHDDYQFIFTCVEEKIQGDEEGIEHIEENVKTLDRVKHGDVPREQREKQ
jgi:hypothetical protein